MAPPAKQQQESQETYRLQREPNSSYATRNSTQDSPTHPDSIQKAEYERNRQHIKNSPRGHR